MEGIFKVSLSPKCLGQVQASVPASFTQFMSLTGPPPPPAQPGQVQLWEREMRFPDF